MNKREAAVISAYTGILIGSFSDLHEYIEEVFERSVWTSEMSPEFMEILKAKSKEEFLRINEEIKKL